MTRRLPGPDMGSRLPPRRGMGHLVTVDGTCWYGQVQQAES